MTDHMVPPKRRERVWPWVVGIAVVIVVALAFMVPIPRYLEGPGSTRNTEELVRVSGRDSFDSDGQILYTTVSQSRATTASLIRAWFNPNYEIKTPEQMGHSGDRQADRQIEQAQMDRSKLTALVVAFAVLDLPLTITGQGALVQYVEPEAPAAAALNAGDVITAVNGEPVTTASELRDVMVGSAPGDRVTVTVLAGADAEAEAVSDVEVELVAAEDDPERGILGVRIQTFNEDIDTGFEIELDSGKVIGPSAGLAWTLGVIDRLTPGDLTGGRTIAVTGTIDTAGNVGAVGGIEKKVVSAIRDGATLFIYPESTSPQALEAMKKAAGDKIELQSVSTIIDALDVLGAGDLVAERG